MNRTTAPARSRWRPTPAQLARLIPGLWLFGTGEALILETQLGNTPWTILAEGLSLRTPMTVGVATLVTGVVVLLGWIPLRERPGLGTVLNIVVISAALDVMLAVFDLGPGTAVRWAALLGGVALVGLGSGLYLTAALGPGPRDGWMTGLSRATGWRLGVVRLGIETSVLVAGWLLGGTVGIGTVAFALLIGPAVDVAVRLVAPRGGARRAPRPVEPVKA